MKKRVLGRTGLEVGELSLGAAFITKGGEGIDGAARIVHEALDAGMNLIDTSADYGDSEEGVGEALKDEARPSIVSTKLGPRSGSFNPKDAQELRDSVAQSLRRLHRDRIDILMIHEPDRPGEIDWWDDLRNFTGPVMDVLQELKEKGTIRFTGLGGTTAYEIVPIMATGFFDVVLTAFNYSMLWREAAIELLPEAKRQNMGVLLGSPTQQGWLAHRYDSQLDRANGRWLNKPRREQLRRLYRLVDEAGMPIAEMALRWALMNVDATTVLTGPRTIDQLRQNIQAAESGPLPDDIVVEIDAIAELVPFRPYEEPAYCPYRVAEFDMLKRPGPVYF